MPKSFREQLEEAAQLVKQKTSESNYDSVPEDRSYLPPHNERQYRRPNSTLMRYVCMSCQKSFESPIIYNSFMNPRCDECKDERRI